MTNLNCQHDRERTAQNIESGAIYESISRGESLVGGPVLGVRSTI